MYVHALKMHMCIHIYAFLADTNYAYTCILWFALYLSCTVGYQPLFSFLDKPFQCAPGTELDGGTSGVGIVTKLFSLVTNFSCFSLKYFCWRLNVSLKT